MARKRLALIAQSVAVRKAVRDAASRLPELEIATTKRSLRELRSGMATDSLDMLLFESERQIVEEFAAVRRTLRQKLVPLVAIDHDEETHQRLQQMQISVITLSVSDGSKGHRIQSLATVLGALAKTHISGSGAPAGGVEHGVGRVQSPPSWNGRIVLIGSSTGGVGAIETILSGLPKCIPPILLSQHMPAAYLERFAARLNERYAPEVRIARRGSSIRPGEMLLAPGGSQNLVLSQHADPVIELKGAQGHEPHCPSVDVMLRSGVMHASRIIAVMLTGMGADGAQAMAELHREGALCLAQDRASSTVYGMPRAAVDLGAVHDVLPLKKIADRLMAETFSAGRMETV